MMCSICQQTLKHWNTLRIIKLEATEYISKSSRLQKPISVQLIHTQHKHTHTGKLASASTSHTGSRAVSPVSRPGTALGSEGLHHTRRPDAVMSTTETTQTQRAQKDKPCLPVLLLGIIHQQTLAQKALALLSTETSELEFGCFLCLKRDDLRAGDEGSALASTPGSL